MISKGNIILTKIIAITAKGIATEYKNFNFFIPKNFLSDFSKKELLNNFTIGQYIYVKIEHIDNDNLQGIANFKILHPLYIKNQKSYSLVETKNGFKNLKKHLLNEIE
ncbi:hypothetical protein VBM87_01890 [Mycoplasma sp. 744]|uniref:hypothetical protein n=1 Tax=Mycoplasma sp. 744 TaxID=3108531 RepID=UPI002B1D1DA4|nr:hypothetical protein [Mycoplasma sp. 744]MEA4115530.1 hypothetical protein [Mycoplasma sp. 744]